MNFIDKYEEWLSKFDSDSDEYRELISIKDDYKEIEDRFYKELAFGTAGMRGVLGLGTNRLNIFNARKLSIGLAKYINDNYDIDKKVVIAHDNRYMSDEFSQECAKCLAKEGIKVYLFNELKTTPMLSYMVRKLGCVSGIMITASHNPSNYNGIKVYNDRGAQITTPEAKSLEKYISDVKDIFDIDFENDFDIYSKIFYAHPEIDEIYLDEVRKAIIREEMVKEHSKEVGIVYTPLCGTGLKPVTKVLSDWGFEDLTVVPEEKNPDPEFSGIKKPNPEEEKALTRGIELLKSSKKDILIATDPDCDRLGVAIRIGDEVILINGNEIGALFTYYVLTSLKESGKLPENPYIIKSVVTSDLGLEIAKSLGVEAFEMLTGFRFMAEKIEEFEKNTNKNFVMGYEESYGYLVKGICRDKDGVSASLMMAEMTLYYKLRGMNLKDALEEIYKKYGYYSEKTTSLTLEGKEGSEKISRIMSYLRVNGISEINKDEVVEIIDFTKNIKGFEYSNVLKYRFKSGSWIAVRPSGTEPKLKIYFSARSNSMESSVLNLSEMEKGLFKIIDIVE